MIREKISKHDFRFVEKLLYDYKTHDTAIKEMEAELQDILENMFPNASASYVDMSEPKGETDSQPEAWVIKRDENLRVKYLRGRIAERKRHKAAIAAARESLDDMENQLVWLKYDLEKTSRDCWRSMGLQKSRFYEIREEIVTKVARFIGLI